MEAFYRSFLTPSSVLAKASRRQYRPKSEATGGYQKCKTSTSDFEDRPSCLRVPFGLHWTLEHLWLRIQCWSRCVALLILFVY